MTEERYNYLMKQADNLVTNEEACLTNEEVLEGWHWCWDWDGLLVGPGMAELSSCSCWSKGHPVYKTIPEIEKNYDPSK